MTHALQTLLESIVSANGEMRYDAFAAAMRSFNLPEAVKDDDYTVVEADRGSLVVLDKTTAITLSLPAVATAGAGFQFFAANINTGGGTADPDGAETINGASTLAIPQGAFARIWVNAAGDGWRAEIGFDPAKVVFTGGTMDGVAIGGTTPAAGAFTDLAATDTLASPTILSVDRSLLRNLLPDSGRFQGNANNHNRLGSYSAPSYLSNYNSGSIANYGEFIFDNTTYGGAGGALEAEVDTLIQKIRGGGDKRYGIEWNVALITQGVGTLNGVTIGSDTLYVSNISATVPWPQLPDLQTAGFYLKAKTGKCAIGWNPTTAPERVSYDGSDLATTYAAEHVLENADGWVWVEMATPSFAGLGYNVYALSARMTGGGECWIALPKVVPGDVRLHGMEIFGNTEMFGDL